MFGGGGGGGKSSGALMRLLKYADVPGYAGWGLRINFAQMMKSDAILARAIEWWRGKPGVRWDPQTHTFAFQCPGGGTSTISFGHMDSGLSFYDYQGAAGHCIIFDELTHFEERAYKYLFSRQRRPTEGPLKDVPLFTGSTANPGGTGHAWVKARFVDPETRNPRAVYIHSTMVDNPSIDKDSYLESLAEMDPVTRAQLEQGSWDELEPGDFFDQSNFVLIQEAPANLGFMRKVRYWDFAGTEKTKKNKDPDFTASCKMAVLHGHTPGDITYYILDITEDRWDAGVLPDMVRLQAVEDTRSVAVRWEMEGGSSGIIASERAIKPELSGYDADGIRSTGSKVQRARPLAAKVNKRRVYVLEGDKTKRFLDQCHRFPAVEHDDMVDAASGAFNWLLEHARGEVRGEAVRSTMARALDANDGASDRRVPVAERGRQQRPRKVWE
jgi:predicted phage terminase large subunit-like protein